MSRTKYVTLSIIFWSHWVRVKVWRNCLLWCCQTIARVSKILLLVTAVRIVYFYDWQLMLILWQGGLIRLVPPTSYFFLDRWDWGMWPPPATWYSVSEWEEGSHSHHQNDKHLPACTPLFPGHHTLLEKDRQDLTIIAHLHCLLLQTLSRLFSEWQSSKNTTLNKDHYYIRLAICSCLVRNEIIPMN